MPHLKFWTNANSKCFKSSLIQWSTKLCKTIVKIMTSYVNFRLLNIRLLHAALRCVWSTIDALFWIDVYIVQLEGKGMCTISTTIWISHSFLLTFSHGKSAGNSIFLWTSNPTLHFEAATWTSNNGDLSKYELTWNTEAERALLRSKNRVLLTTFLKGLNFDMTLNILCYFYQHSLAWHFFWNICTSKPSKRIKSHPGNVSRRFHMKLI